MVVEQIFILQCSKIFIFSRGGMQSGALLSMQKNRLDFRLHPIYARISMAILLRSKSALVLKTWAFISRMFLATNQRWFSGSFDIICSILGDKKPLGDLPVPKAYKRRWVTHRKGEGTTGRRQTYETVRSQKTRAGKPWTWHSSNKDMAPYQWRDIILGNCLYHEYQRNEIHSGALHRTPRPELI